MKRSVMLVVVLVVGWVLVPAVSEAEVSPPPPPEDYLDFSSGSISVAIPDLGSASNTIDVGSLDAVIVDLNVSVVISHTSMSDIKLLLKHIDSGTEIVLMNQPGYPCYSDDMDATFDDASATPVASHCNYGPVGILGTFAPDDPLSGFWYETMGGEWKLTVEDLDGLDVGTLDSWTLHFGVLVCSGLPATIIGSAGDDIRSGTSGPDVIDVLGGHDTVYGLGGDDVICLGDGDDYAEGGDGADLIYGDDGEDEIYGDNGADTIYGGSKRDDIRGGKGADEIVGGPGNDRIWGDGNADLAHGGGGNDRIRGGVGDDMLYGDAGDDKVIGQGGDDTLIGGDDTDVAKGKAGIDTCDAETELSCEI